LEEKKNKILFSSQRVGRVTIKELKRRGITGETLRREIWDPKTPSTQSPNARFYFISFFVLLET